MAKQKKLPALQFYTGDWMKDPNLRGVSLAAKGLWIEMLCLMHESDRRGYLQSNGKPIAQDRLARMTGSSSEEVSQCLEELENSGVFSRTKNGVIYSRRMKRDEETRQKSIINGRLGGNPALKDTPEGVKGGVNPLDNPKRGSSVSTSTSVSTPNNPATQKKDQNITQGGCRGDGEPPGREDAASVPEAQPRGSSCSSLSGSWVTGFSTPSEIPWREVDASHIFGVFRDLFLECGLSGADELARKARKCRAPPIMWASLFLDKVQYAHGRENADPVALAVSGFQKKQTPTDAACGLFKDIFLARVGNPDMQGKRWELMTGALIAEELAKRKGKKR